MVERSPAWRRIWLAAASFCVAALVVMGIGCGGSNSTPASPTPIALTLTDAATDAGDFDDHDHLQWRVAAYGDHLGRIAGDLRQQRQPRARHGVRSASGAHRVSCDQRCRISAARAEQNDGQPEHAALVRLPRSQSADGHFAAGHDHDPVNRRSLSVRSCSGSLATNVDELRANLEVERLIRMSRPASAPAPARLRLDQLSEVGGHPG